MQINDNIFVFSHSVANQIEFYLISFFISAYFGGNLHLFDLQMQILIFLQIKYYDNIRFTNFRCTVIGGLGFNEIFRYFSHKIKVFKHIHIYLLLFIIPKLIISMYNNWYEFQSLPFVQVESDFCHKQPLVTTFSTFQESYQTQLKSQIVFEKNKCNFNDQVYFKAKNSQQKIIAFLSNKKIKFGYEKQVDKKQDHQLSAYAWYRSNRKFQETKLTLGSLWKMNGLFLNTKLKTALNDEKNQFVLSNKFQYQNNKSLFGLATAINLNLKMVYMNNIVIGLKPNNKNHLYLRGEVKRFRNYVSKFRDLNDFFDNIIFDYVIKPSNNVTILSEVKYDLQQKKLDYFSNLIEVKFPNKNKTIKLKLKNMNEFTFLYKSPLSIGSNSSYSCGISISSIMIDPRVSYGFKFDVNY